MDSFMEYYFDGVFSNMDRDGLNERYKRRELVEYFNTVIAGCARGYNFHIYLHFLYCIVFSFNFFLTLDVIYCVNTFLFDRKC